MAYDYDKLYGETPDALGEPTQVFVDFFAGFKTLNARVLDVGCGQGRDALFIARLGHQVVGVDMSANGVRDLLVAADGMNVEAVVADVVSFVPDGLFDVVLIDRTLHMLTEVDRLAVLARLLDHVAMGGWVLIADEKANMAGFKDQIAAHSVAWTTTLNKGGTLFVHRA
jgi:2-polyprenyl-3-methyl-5-hydroxy-6-metoxy-1,4-benzoquinol methylase